MSNFEGRSSSYSREGPSFIIRHSKFDILRFVVLRVFQVVHPGKVAILFGIIKSVSN